MVLTDYPEWKEAIDRIASSSKVVMLLGDTDCGKTTFSALLCNAALAAGRRVAVVDADIGQSEIGPPCCVGWGLMEAPIHTLGDITARGLAFVGSTSPVGRLLEHTVATRLMADIALQENPDLLLVDTTGFVQGVPARRLKRAKWELLRPDTVVTLERKNECDLLVRMMDRSDAANVVRLPVAVAIGNKPPAIRALRRSASFVRYFTGAEEYSYDIDQLVMEDTWLNNADPLAPHLQKFLAEAFGVKVFHAELSQRHLGLITDGPGRTDHGMSAAREQFRVETVTLTPAKKLQHLLVGILDTKGKLLAVGLIESIDFRRRTIGILSPVKIPAVVRGLRFGALRVQPDGRQLGVNQPGEV